MVYSSVNLLFRIVRLLVDGFSYQVWDPAGLRSAVLPALGHDVGPAGVDANGVILRGVDATPHAADGAPVAGSARFTAEMDDVSLDTSRRRMSGGRQGTSIMRCVRDIQPAVTLTAGQTTIVGVRGSPTSAAGRRWEGRIAHIAPRTLRSFAPLAIHEANGEQPKSRAGMSPFGVSLALPSDFAKPIRCAGNAVMMAAMKSPTRARLIGIPACAP